MGARQEGIRRHFAIAMEDVDRVSPPVHLHQLANEPEAHGVAVGVQADQVVLRHDP